MSEATRPPPKIIKLVMGTSGPRIWWEDGAKLGDNWKDQPVHTYRLEPSPDDPPCTDCDDTGITIQTERYCTCSAGLWRRGLGDGSCIRCDCAPCNADGICATCEDESAIRARTP